MQKEYIGLDFKGLEEGSTNKEPTQQEWGPEFNPQNLQRKVGIVVHVCNPVLGMGRQEDHQASLAIQSSLIGDLQAMRYSVSQEVDSILRMTPKTVLASAYLHTYMNMNPTCMNMHI